MWEWLADRIGIVRLRQLLERVRHRLAFVPLVMTAVSVVAAQLFLLLDRSIGDKVLPGLFSTTVESARAILGTIAGGLITAFTLLISMMLVAVQLASGQFSPRSMRNWLSDTTLQRTVGVVMATTVFCLLGLRSARDFGDEAIIPNITVIVAVLAGIVSLVMVVRAVDHVTSNLQIGTVVRRICNETLTVIATASETHENPDIVAEARGEQPFPPIPTSAVVVESDRGGWVQQIDTAALTGALPRGSTAWVPVVYSDFVPIGSPLAWIEIPEPTLADATPEGHEDPEDEPDEDESLGSRVRSAFAIGDSRTMQRDIGFGLSQLADIAVRALSPGINDPQTAQDVIRHLGEVMLALWSHDEAPSRTSEDGRTIHHRAAGHGAHLRTAFDPIRHYGRSDPAVMLRLGLTIVDVAREVVRRKLPGSIQPLETFLDDVRTGCDDAQWLSREREAMQAVSISSD